MGGTGLMEISYSNEVNHLKHRDTEVTEVWRICANLISASSVSLRFQSEIERRVDPFCFPIDADVTGSAALVGK
jgi:hypothetical protein